MRENVTKFAEELHQQSSERLRTDKFYIAGGALRDFVESGSKYPKDVDCFFQSETEFNIAKLSLKAEGFVVVKERNNSVVFEKVGSRTYDLVLLDYITCAADIIVDFDFTNCCIAFGKEGLVTTGTFFEDVVSMTLKINNIKLPYHTIQRAGKFMARGYSLSDDIKINLFNTAAYSPVGPYDEEEYSNSEMEDKLDVIADKVPF